MLFGLALSTRHKSLTLWNINIYALYSIKDKLFFITQNSVTQRREIWEKSIYLPEYCISLRYGVLYSHVRFGTTHSHEDYTGWIKSHYTLSVYQREQSFFYIWVSVHHKSIIYNKPTRYKLDFCLTVHHQLGKVTQKNQLDATMIYWSIRSAQHVSGNILSILRSERLRYLQYMASCCCGG